MWSPAALAWSAALCCVLLETCVTPAGGTERPSLASAPSLLLLWVVVVVDEWTHTHTHTVNCSHMEARESTFACFVDCYFDTMRCVHTASL